MSKLTELETRIAKAATLGEKWAGLHATWIQLEDDKKNYLAALMNDIDDGNMSEAKLERKARASKEYREYVKNLAIAKGEELRAKVLYDNARDFFEAGRSQESTEREKMKTFGHIP